ncbi:MAG: hypothetical protein MZV70_45440 [Desulfobacterales bacterium]|nr:hypothetical protein [Desulfobacterales bacterium]
MREDLIASWKVHAVLGERARIDGAGPRRAQWTRRARRKHASLQGLRRHRGVALGLPAGPDARRALARRGRRDLDRCARDGLGREWPPALVARMTLAEAAWLGPARRSARRDLPFPFHFGVAAFARSDEGRFFPANDATPALLACGYQEAAAGRARAAPAAAHGRRARRGLEGRVGERASQPAANRRPGAPRGLRGAPAQPFGLPQLPLGRSSGWQPGARASSRAGGGPHGSPRNRRVARRPDPPAVGARRGAPPRRHRAAAPRAAPGDAAPRRSRHRALRRTLRGAGPSPARVHAARVAPGRTRPRLGRGAVAACRSAPPGRRALPPLPAGRLDRASCPGDRPVPRRERDLSAATESRAAARGRVRADRSARRRRDCSRGAVRRSPGPCRRCRR